MASPVATHSPLFYLHWTVPAGASIQLPTASERAVYLVTGQVETAGSALRPGQMLVYSRDEDAVVRATSPAVVMALGGEPIGERFIDWNFVSSSKERIQQAKADWRAGRMKLPDFDNQESIPLPPEPPPAPATPL